MEGGQFSKQLLLWQKDSTTQRTIPQITGPDYLSEHVLQSYIKIHLRRDATNSILESGELQKKKKIPSNYGKHLVCQSKFKKKGTTTTHTQKNFSVNFLETQLVS